MKIKKNIITLKLFLISSISFQKSNEDQNKKSITLKLFLILSILFQKSREKKQKSIILKLPQILFILSQK